MSYQDLAEQSAIYAQRIMSLEGDLAAARARNIKLIADLGIKDAEIAQLRREMVNAQRNAMTYFQDTVGGWPP